MIQQLIKKLLAREDLTRQEAATAMNIIMSGEATPAQIAGYLIALRCKGETVAEITGSAQVMREKAQTITTKWPFLVDTCGTGGDSLGTINVSTTAALVAAGAGVAIAKHGNRSVSSLCGSADLLMELGVCLDAEQATSCLDEARIAFLFAPMMHSAMKHAMGPRRELKVRTIFNILGPLTNPAGAQAQVIGVFSNKLTETLAHVLKNLGSQHVFVVHGSDGMDEVTMTGVSHVSELTPDGMVRSYDIDPRDYGMRLCTHQELAGQDAAFNAQITKDILSGKDHSARRDIVVLNAALAIVVSGIASGIAAGVELAQKAIDSGAAMQKLEQLIKCSNPQH